jgi:hypothetical protein
LRDLKYVLTVANGVQQGSQRDKSRELNGGGGRPWSGGGDDEAAGEAARIAQSGNLESVERAIARGDDINGYLPDIAGLSVDDAGTLLILACLNNHLR